MELDFFSYLPSELTTEILSRLSIRSLAISKSVCKPWLNLINSDDFPKSEIKTPPALALLTPKERDSTRCTIFEIKDEDEDEVDDAEKSHDLHYIPLTDLVIPHGNRAFIDAITARGLLLLYSPLPKGIHVYICNPMTREYTELCCPEAYAPGQLLKFGFGVSEMSGQYKVVYRNADTESQYVYTLGTGIWRRVEARAVSGFRFFGPSIVCNGNVHWMVFDLNDNLRICGFDVETECFRIFSAPPMGYRDGDLSVLRGCLCYSYTRDNEIVIWMMKEYGVDGSWTVEFKLSTVGCDDDWDDISIDPIRHFKDGDVLMLLYRYQLIYYSNKARTIQEVGMFKDAVAGYLTALIFTPTLLSLKNFGFENVISF